MKKIVTLLLSLLMSAAMAATVFAGTGAWIHDGSGWRWRRSNGSYARNEWLWIDGNGDGWAECYNFDSRGYMRFNTYYDGYMLNSDGKWVDDYNDPYLYDEPNEWVVQEAKEVAYPTGAFRFDTELSNGVVKITKSGGVYYCDYVREGYYESGDPYYESVVYSPLYRDGYNSFVATDGAGDTIRFNYYGANSLYDVSFNGGWGEVYTK
ncbi:MAG: hypothetical protein IJT43_11945 [Stomatobaculum sp.]|nr:hypothetical protein [Stomatobaculum sp.]